MTDARSITARSSPSSRSRRAVRSAWIVGGIRRLDRSPLTTQLPLLRSSKPSSTSIRRVSPTNNGFPSAASAIRARASSASCPPPSRLLIRPSVSASVSGGSETSDWFALPVSQLPRASTSSGRARKSSMTGTPRIQSARYSSRSRNVGSAHWMSSKTTRSGRRWASVSRSFRTDQNVSWTPGVAESSPRKPPSRSATSAESGASSRRRSSFRRASLGGSDSLTPVAPCSSSVIGQKVIPSPYGRQRPPTTVARSPIDATSSPVSRDFPTPATPMTVAT